MFIIKIRKEDPVGIGGTTISTPSSKLVSVPIRWTGYQQLQALISWRGYARRCCANSRNICCRQNDLRGTHWGAMVSRHRWNNVSEIQHNTMTLADGDITDHRRFRWTVLLWCYVSKSPGVERRRASRNAKHNFPYRLKHTWVYTWRRQSFTKDGTGGLYGWSGHGNEYGGKIIAISDCEPDVVELEDIKEQRQTDHNRYRPCWDLTLHSKYSTLGRYMPFSPVKQWVQRVIMIIGTSLLLILIHCTQTHPQRETNLHFHPGRELLPEMSLC